MPGRKPAPTLRLRRLAAELRQARKAAGLSRDDVVERTGVNSVTLYRIEAARVRPQPRTLRTLLDVYGIAEPRRAELAALLKEAKQRGWLHALADRLPEHHASYIEFEAEAREVRTYESLFVPGLLQTEDYARAVVQGTLPDAAPEEAHARVEARLRRQAALGGAGPLGLHAVVDEAAVRRAVGGPGVMRAQVRHLADALRRPNITLQVIPFEAGAHPGMPGPFVLMSFPAAMGADVVYCEGQAGDVFLEEAVDVRRYALAFDRLRTAALSPAESALLIESAAEPRT